MNRRAAFLPLLAPFVVSGLSLLSAGAAQAAEPKKKGGGLSYIPIQTLTATIFRTDGSRGVLTVETGIDVPDEAFRVRAAASTPRLRAAYAQTLQIYASGLRPAAVPNADYIATELQQQTDRVLARQGARVLLGAILAN